MLLHMNQVLSFLLGNHQFFVHFYGTLFYFPSYNLKEKTRGQQVSKNSAHPGTLSTFQTVSPSIISDRHLGGNLVGFFL